MIEAEEADDCFISLEELSRLGANEASGTEIQWDDDESFDILEKELPKAEAEYVALYNEHGWRWATAKDEETQNKYVELVNELLAIFACKELLHRRQTINEMLR